MPGLSEGLQDFQSSLQHAGSLAVACELLVAAGGCGSLTRDQMGPSELGTRNLSHWATREVPERNSRFTPLTFQFPPLTAFPIYHVSLVEKKLESAMIFFFFSHIQLVRKSCWLFHWHMCRSWLLPVAISATLVMPPRPLAWAFVADLLSLLVSFLMYSSPHGSQSHL